MFGNSLPINPSTMLITACPPSKPGIGRMFIKPKLAVMKAINEINEINPPVFASSLATLAIPTIPETYYKGILPEIILINPKNELDIIFPVFEDAIENDSKKPKSL